MINPKYTKPTLSQEQKLRGYVDKIREYRRLLGDSRFSSFSEQGRSNFNQATKDVDHIVIDDNIKFEGDNRNCVELNVPLAGVMAYFVQNAAYIDARLKQGEKPVKELEKLVFASVLGVDKLKEAVEKHYYDYDSENRMSLSDTVEKLEKDIENAREKFEEKYRILIEQKHNKGNFIRYLAQKRAKEIYESEQRKKEPEAERKRKIKRYNDLIIEGVESIKRGISDEDLARKYKSLNGAETDAFIRGRNIAKMIDKKNGEAKEILERLIRSDMTQEERFALDYVLLKRRYNNQNGKFTEKLGNVLNAWVKDGFGAECSNYIEKVLDTLKEKREDYQWDLEHALKPSEKSKNSGSDSRRPLIGIGVGAFLTALVMVYAQLPSWVKGNPVISGTRDLAPDTFQVVNFYDVDKDGDFDIVDTALYRRKGKEAERKNHKTWLTPEFAEDRYIFSWFYGEVMTPEELEMLEKNYKRLLEEKRDEEMKRNMNTLEKADSNKAE